MVALDLAAPSAFAAGARDAIAAGFHVLAIKPGEKAPGSFVNGQWGGAAGWQQFATTPASDKIVANWTRAPGAGLGIAMGSPAGEGHYVVAVDIDLEDADKVAAIRDVLPTTPIMKTGAKGVTLVYRAPASIVSKAYNIGSARAVDLLAKGRQTVMPPTMHPSGVAYRHVGTGLVPVRELPIFGKVEQEALEAVLRGLGWQEATSTLADHGTSAGVASQVQERDAAGDYFREINDAALAALDAWVPALALPNMVADGRGGFAATAFWRPSSGGRDLAARDAHLSFSRKGIVDFGDGEKGYTAIDVVVAATGNSSSEAAAWLASRLGLDADDGTIDFDALTANLEAKAARLQVATEETVVAEIVAKLDSAITWDDRDANKALSVGWLVKKLLPDRGVSLLFGQSGAGKSFVALELAACTITGQPFFGHRIKAPGGVLFALGEASGTMPDRMEAVRRGRFNEQAPADPITGGTLNFKSFPVAWVPVSDLAKPAPWRAFADHVRTVAADMLAMHGRKLRLVIVDTIVASFGFADDPDAAAATKAMKSMDDLAQELDLLFLPVHHAGKSVAAGAHGTYAWTGSAETSIEVSAARDDATSAVTGRRVTLRKNRHAGNEGWNQPFDLKEIELRVDEDGDPVTSAIVVPKAPGEGANDNAPAITLRTPGISRFMRAAEPVRQHATFRAALNNGEEVDAVHVANVRAQYVADHPGKKDASLRQAFRRGLDEAEAFGLIKVQGQGDQEIVWFLNNGEAAA